MSEHAHASAAPAETPPKPASVVLIVLIAILCGLGIFGAFYWLYTFDWLYFPSVLLVALGCYLLFTRLSGPDHA